MPYYEFRLIGGDGAWLRREHHLAPDLETVWGRVVRLAAFGTDRGRRIHVLDAEGKIVIGIGAKAATLSAQHFQILRGRSDGVWRKDRRVS